MSALLWLGLAALGVFLMSRGANRLCAVSSTLRGRLNLSSTAIGALMGVATATPEITVSAVSVLFGWPALGLGAALGSNVPALPMIFVCAYVAARYMEDDPAPRVAPEAVEIQALPYFLTVLLLAALTLPPPWAGLSPIDAAFLGAAFGLWFLRALLKPDGAPTGAAVPASVLKPALLGLPMIACGGLLAVFATRRLADLWGISDLVGGLFIIGLLCAFPETVAAWSLVRAGRTTTAVASAMSDGIVSLSLALVLPALVGTAVGERALYLVNLVFLSLVLAAYLVMSHPEAGGRLGGLRVSLFAAGYGLYLAAVVYVLAT